jgi:hypothetical protein
MTVPNNSTVRWFHSDMAGAPQMTTLSTDALAILDACLITGFGTDTPDGNKITVSAGMATVHFSAGHSFEQYAVIDIQGATPATLNGPWRITGVTATAFTFDCTGEPDGMATGVIAVKRATPGYWEKPFEDATRRAYRSNHPDATGFYLTVDSGAEDPNYVNLDVRGCEDMTDLDTPINSFPTIESEPTYKWGFRHSSGGSVTRAWALFADEKTIYVFTKYDVATDAGGVLRFFGDYKALVPTIFNCGLTGAEDNEYQPGRESAEHYVNLKSPVIATPRDLGGGVIGGNWIYRGNALPGTYIFGMEPHPNHTGAFLLSGPMLLVDYSVDQPRGFEPALYKCTSGYQGLFDDPDAQLEGAFKVIGGSEATGKITALIRVAYDDRDTQSGCTGIDIEGPWA